MQKKGSGFNSPSESAGGGRHFIARDVSPSKTSAIASIFEGLTFLGISLALTPASPTTGTYSAYTPPRPVGRTG